jgi:hypothetical protein
MKYLLLLATIITCTTVFALPRRMQQDIKLPTQKVIEAQAITDPGAADADAIENEAAGGTSAAAATLSSGFDGQPDVPRNVVITPSATTTDIESCVITVSGTNIRGAAITEDFTFAANDTAAQTGAKAFKTVTSVAFPASCESGGYAATWDIGYGEKLGLSKCIDGTGYFLSSMVAKAYETTRATVVADDDEVEKNTADFNGTMNGANDFVALYIQNFRCI